MLLRTKTNYWKILNYFRHRHYHTEWNQIHLVFGLCFSWYMLQMLYWFGFLLFLANFFRINIITHLCIIIFVDDLISMKFIRVFKCFSIYFCSCEIKKPTSLQWCFSQSLRTFFTVFCNFNTSFQLRHTIYAHHPSDGFEWTSGTKSTNNGLNGMKFLRTFSIFLFIYIYSYFISTNSQ